MKLRCLNDDDDLRHESLLLIYDIDCDVIQVIDIHTSAVLLLLTHPIYLSYTHEDGRACKLVDHNLGHNCPSDESNFYATRVLGI